MARRFGTVAPVVIGLLAMVVGLISLVLLPANASIWWVSGLMVIVGVGGGFTVPPIAALVLEVAPADLAGTASGVLNTFRQMGGSLGVAVFGSIVSVSAAFLTGLRVDYIVIAVLLTLTAVGAVLVLRDPRRASTN